MDSTVGNSISSLKGVGDAVSKLLNKVGIFTTTDVLLNIPRKYIDYSQVVDIGAMRPGLVTLKVKISSISSRYSKRGLHITQCLASDASGSVKVIWFNQRYRAQSINSGQEYYLSGEFASSIKSRDIVNPSLELVSDFTKNTARIVPIYRLTKGLGVHVMRKITLEALKSTVLDELLPKQIIDDNKLLGRMESLWQMHFPDSEQKLAEAKKRMAYEELFGLILASELNRLDNAIGVNVFKMPFKLEEAKKFVDSLPFKLTDDQRRVVWTIFQDLDSDRPMNRLVEGDVGSGKTVVAVMTGLMAMYHDFSVALMAPTELLANQHFATIKSLLDYNAQANKVVLITGSTQVAEKKLLSKRLESESGLFVIGTHALIQDHLKIKNLGLVIVDEQHRFGVDQRKALQAKSRSMPHVLHMSATPIPRSIALTLYGELDISTIMTLPLHKQSIETSIFVPEARKKVYEYVAGQIKLGHQAYVVCPKIEENNTEKKISRKFSATAIFDELKSGFLKNYRVELVHGKMSAQQKQLVMENFVNGKIDVLVATTVVEVGVNVPNATVMVVEAADSFGLAQLHQLRGRVGRGNAKGYCYLINSENADISRRLRIIEHEQNGYVLADLDLELRGPGAIYGTLQHGALDLRVANLSDRKLIEKVRNDVKKLVINDNLLQYKELMSRVNRLRTITNLN